VTAWQGKHEAKQVAAEHIDWSGGEQALFNCSTVMVGCILCVKSGSQAVKAGLGDDAAGLLAVMVIIVACSNFVWVVRYESISTVLLQAYRGPLLGSRAVVLVWRSVQCCAYRGRARAQNDLRHC
jgi:hypothetical protein